MTEEQKKRFGEFLDRWPALETQVIKERSDLQAELASARLLERRYMLAITNVVWGYDPEEILTVGQYPSDLMRVWGRVQKDMAEMARMLAEALKDTNRIDWLEGEMARERLRMTERPGLPDSLFRRNMPITRSAIDEAMMVLDDCDQSITEPGLMPPPDEIG